MPFRRLFIVARRVMGERGCILLVSCYELGHQPLALASPMAFLERAGFAPEALDISVEPFDATKAARTRFVAISVPMHTALRLGVRVAEQIRQINPACHICFYGLYASLNADYLLAHCGDSVIGGEFESALVALAEALAAGRPGAVEGVHLRGHAASPVLERLPFPVPSRGALPQLKKYAHLDKDGRKGLVGYVEASRGCLHLCLHCPIPPVYGGRFFVVPQETVLADIRQLEREGARHITFGDPDFLNGPGHSLSIVRAMHAELPSLTFDFTAKVEHILEQRRWFPELRRLGCAFMISAVESERSRAGQPREGPLAGRCHARAPDRARGRDRLQAHVGGLHAVDDARGLPRMFEFVEREGLIDHVDPVQFTYGCWSGRLGLLTRDAITPHLGQLDQAAFIHRWTHPDPRMDLLQREASRLVEAAARERDDDLPPAEALAYSTRDCRSRACKLCADRRRRQAHRSLVC